MSAWPSLSCTAQRSSIRRSPPAHPQASPAPAHKSTEPLSQQVVYKSVAVLARPLKTASAALHRDSFVAAVRAAASIAGVVRGAAECLAHGRAHPLHQRATAAERAKRLDIPARAMSVARPGSAEGGC